MTPSKKEEYKLGCAKVKLQVELTILEMVGGVLLFYTWWVTILGMAIDHPGDGVTIFGKVFDCILDGG